jgi:UPF0755 protein
VSNDNLIERVPDATLRKQRASAFVRVLGSLVGWGMFFALTLGALLFWAWGAFTAEGPLKDTKIVTFPEGSSRSEIAATLEDQGVISDSRVMNAATMITSFRGATLKSGEYEFLAGVPMAGVLNAISSGKVLTYKITIPEGWTSQMALARLNSNEILSGDPVIAVPEGALIADTQVFRRGMTRAKLVEDMKAAQAHLIDDIWAKKPANSVLKTKEEMVTLASIVEKETGKAEERPHVAAVFLNRIKKGMRLQSDPTIIYGIIAGAGKLEREITRADIDGKTPYNTYQIDGLPPGPIAVPGRAALEAVIAPKVTEDIFFVADGTGGHVFAATLEAHNDNVKKWRELQKNGIQLPGGAAVEEQPATNDVQQTLLPAVTETPTENTEADAAVDEAAKVAGKVQAVPVPVEGDATAQPVTAAPKAAEPPPLPIEKKPKPAVAETKVETTKVALKPGSVVKVGKKMVPIPLLKKAKP